MIKTKIKNLDNNYILRWKREKYKFVHWEEVPMRFPCDDDLLEIKLFIFMWQWC